MEKLFGTDGIRAVAREFPLDYVSVYTLGKALIKLLQEKELPPRVVVGKDPRESSSYIENAFCHGIEEADGEYVCLGVIPTSAVSLLTKKHSFSAGAVISASHNPYYDNGIKIFSSQGIKLAESWERRLEEEIFYSREKVKEKRNNITPQSEFSQEYIQFLKSRLRGFSFSWVPKVVVDCSHGASSFFAPKVFRDLGFQVKAINDKPDGKNINAGCGSLYPQGLAQKVVEEKADLGVAYDGDADRAIWVDEGGNLLNGDHTLFVLSHYMKEKASLTSPYVVGTVMSNLGLEKALQKINLKLYRAKVGDKYVLEQMVRLGSNLGGEQSGHTIFLDECPTGDGLLTSLKMLEVMVKLNSPLSTLVADFEEHPQFHSSIRVTKKDDFNLYPEIVETMKKIKQSLGNEGRVNVRYSGTEPVARIMIEGKNREQIKKQAQHIAKVIEKHLGA